VVVGEDVAFRADNDAGTQAGGALGLVIEAVTKEMAEDRVVEQRVAGGLHFLAGEDVHHGRQGATHRLPEAALYRPVVAGGEWCFLQGDNAARLLQPFGLEGADDEQHGKTHRHGLCKNQPDLAHEK